MDLAKRIYKSMVGALHLVASDQGLRGIYTSSPNLKNLSSTPSKKALGILQQTEAQLNEYFQGRRTKFDLPLDLQGTPFQKSVWKSLLSIPYGKTVSYKDIALQIKNPGAMRAVGSANGKNPVCIVVPCHRVIAADGGIGGYSGGLPMKRSLLKIETGHL